MTDPRQKLATAIASLPADCNQDDCSKALDPLFLVVPELEHDSSVDITPLMVACDKGNVACLRYLEHKYPASAANFIGRPLDPSKANKNTAMHHAAMSGCATAIDILIRMGGTALDLGSARNDHGDSPIMMAATGGHFEFCNFWHGAVAAPDAARAVLEMRNDSNDTALSLASCHGHIHLVEFLLDDCGVGVDLEHVKKCRTSLNRMGTALRSNPALLQQFKDQIEAVAKCVKKLEEKMARRAEEAAQQLMLQEVEESKATKSKQTKKKKSKRKQTATPVGSKLDTSENSFSSKSENNGEKIDSVRLTTLSDGKMAVSVQGPSYTGTTTDRSPLFTTPVRPQSADDMFRQRLQGVSKEVDYDSVMTALCLDVSMLLYSPHGMALNLSPSQLDAIQGILENQIRAVQEARDIQKRVHNTSNTQNIDSS